MAYSYEPLEYDVLEGARRRARKILHSFDTVYISFSGGKDSLVTLHIFESVCRKEGIANKIKVIHRDEEFVPGEVVLFVRKLYLSGRYDFRYFCLQTIREHCILGQVKQIITWDKKRKPFRRIPGFAITDWDNIYKGAADSKCTEGSRGNVCLLTGLRAAESLTRRRAINVSPCPFLSNTKVSNISIGRIIYDWEEKDVLKYLFDNQIDYCKIYDKQAWNQEELRTGEYLRTRTSRVLPKLKSLYPKFWSQLSNYWPEAHLQEKYYADIRTDNITFGYPVTWAGIYKYINDKIEPKLRNIAKKRVRQCFQARKNREAKDLCGDNYGGYPIYYVLKKITAGQFLNPIAPIALAKGKDHEYERAAKQTKSKRTSL